MRRVKQRHSNGPTLLPWTLPTNLSVSGRLAPVRGEVWIVSFPPATGREIQKTRPAVVVSNDTSNALINRVQVVPISNQVARIYSAECLVSVGEQPRKAMADQVTTISKDRLMRLVSQLTKDDMEAVARAVRIQLGL